MAKKDDNGGLLLLALLGFGLYQAFKYKAAETADVVPGDLGPREIEEIIQSDVLNNGCGEGQNCGGPRPPMYPIKNEETFFVDDFDYSPPQKNIYELNEF